MSHIRMTQPRAQHRTSTIDRLKIVGMRWRVRMLTPGGSVGQVSKPAVAWQVWKPAARLLAAHGPLPAAHGLGLAQEAQHRAVRPQADPVARSQPDWLGHRAVVDPGALAAVVAELVAVRV